MNISPNVLIMTRAEFEDEKLKAFHRGCERGRFEQRCDDSNANNPQRGAVEKQDPASPDAGGGPKFQPDGWTFDDHGNGVVYVKAPSGKHAAIGYMAPGDRVLSGILHELVGAVLAFNATTTE